MWSGEAEFDFQVASPVVNITIHLLPSQISINSLGDFDPLEGVVCMLYDQYLFKNCLKDELINGVCSKCPWPFQHDLERFLGDLSPKEITFFMLILSDLDLLKMTLGKIWFQSISLLLVCMLNGQYLFKNCWKEKLFPNKRCMFQMTFPFPKWH
jgi:hypothetical protein